MAASGESVLAKHTLNHNSHYKPISCLPSSNTTFHQVVTSTLTPMPHATFHKLATDIEKTLPRNQCLLVLVDYRSK